MKRLFALGMCSMWITTSAFAEPVFLNDFDILPSQGNSLRIRMTQVEPAKSIAPTKNLASEKNSHSTQHKKLMTSRSVKPKRLLSSLQQKNQPKNIALSHPVKTKKVAALTSKNHVKPLNGQLKKLMAHNSKNYAAKIDALIKKQKVVLKKMRSKRIVA